MKKLFATALAAIFLVTGCTKEIIKEVPVPGSGGNTEEVGDTYVKFSLDANMVKTRASGDHGSLQPTTDENKVYNYALLIFKSTGMLEATLVGKSPTLDAPLEPTPNSNGDRLLTFTAELNDHLEWNEAKDAIRISAGAKTFFAVVNAPKEFIDDQDSFIHDKTLTLEELKELTLTLDNKKLNKIVGQYGIIPNGTNELVHLENPVGSGDDQNRGFMMTNIQSGLQSNGFRTMSLEEKEEEEAPYEVRVDVGRAMAKVSLASDLKSYNQIVQGTEMDLDQKNGVLETQEYKIINNPNKMNIALNIKSGIITTPYMGEDLVTTNNYFPSNNSSHEGNAISAESYYIPVSKSGVAKTFNYCIENANNKPKYGNATIALIRGQYTPLQSPHGQAVILDANCDPATLAEKQTFFRVWIDGYDDVNGDPQGKVYVDEYFTAEPNEAALRQYLEDDNRGVPTSVALTPYEYENGLCYYYLPLYNKEKENNGDPYTVVRNSYYKIDIKSVEGPGYPEKPGEPGEPGGPDKPGPEVPIEAQTYIQAEIVVADWDEVNQTGNL